MLLSAGGRVQREVCLARVHCYSSAQEKFIDDPNNPGQVATLVEVFLVRLSEYEQFVEPVGE